MTSSRLNLCAEMSRKKRNGLVIVYTGDGKGKTTSAFGIAFRAMGWGWKVLVIQFFKKTSISGEKHFAEKFSLPIDIVAMETFYDEKNFESFKKAACQKLLDFLKQQILNNKYDLIILDEVNIAVDRKLIDIDDLLAILKTKSKWLHIILTGRNAHSKLIAVADLVSEIASIKHPFEKGVKAQKGIEF